MATTVSIAPTTGGENQNNNADVEKDPNGYYTVQVSYPVGDFGPPFETQTVVKIKQKIIPAEGTDEIKLGVHLSDQENNSLDIPDSGFTVKMKSVFVSRVDGIVQALLISPDVDFLLRTGANYVETMLVTIPFGQESYMNLRPGKEFYLTVELQQPPVVTSEVADETVDADEKLIVPPVVLPEEDAAKLTES